jgi:molybdenum cofactor cytidylyltransferase
MLIAVIPASGKSRRFGSDKRQALIDGVPMLERVVRLLDGAGAARVIVVDNNPDPDRGMFSTIQIGLTDAVTAGADIVLVQPGDMPFVRAETIRAVVDECRRTRRAVCPRFSGKRGHPLAIPSSLARQLLDVNPSTPLNEAFAAIGLIRHELDVDDPGVLRDVDVPSDLDHEEQ